jgi:prolipoprotein diacylglyceryltransferase
MGADWSVIIFVLLWFTRKDAWDAGAGYGFVVMAYSMGAMLVGFTRGDEVPRLYGWRIDQLLDALLVAAGAIGLWRVRKTGQRSIATTGLDNHVV